MPTAAEILVNKRGASKKSTTGAGESTLAAAPSIPLGKSKKEEGGLDEVPRTNTSLNTMLRDIIASNNNLNDTSSSPSITTSGGERNLEVQSLFKSLIQSLQYQTMIAKESESALAKVKNRLLNGGDKRHFADEINRLQEIVYNKEEHIATLTNHMDELNDELISLRGRVANLESAYHTKEVEFESQVVSLVSDRESLIATIMHHEGAAAMKAIEIQYLKRLLTENGVDITSLPHHVEDGSSGSCVTNTAPMPSNSLQSNNNGSYAANGNSSHGAVFPSPRVVSPEPLKKYVPLPHPHPKSNRDYSNKNVSTNTRGNRTSNQQHSNGLSASSQSTHTRSPPPFSSSRLIAAEMEGSKHKEQSVSPPERRQRKPQTSQRRGTYFGLYSPEKARQQDSPKLVLVASIDFEEGVAHDVEIYEGDNLRRKAENFCQEKSLDHSFVEPLYEYLKPGVTIRLKPIKCCCCFGISCGPPTAVNRIKCTSVWVVIILIVLGILAGVLWSVIVGMAYNGWLEVAKVCQKPWYLNSRLWKFDATYYKGGDETNNETPHHPAFAEPQKYHWSEAEAVSVNDSKLVEDDFFTSKDGLQLHYWYVKGKPTMPAVIVIHGHHDCMGRWETANPMNVLYRAGFTVMGIDLRNHAASDNNKVSKVFFGGDEYIDVLSAFDFLQSKKQIPPESIGIFGSSMGGGIVTITLAMEPKIRAAWADSPVGDTKGVLLYNVQSTLGASSFSDAVTDAAWSKISQDFKDYTGKEYDDFSPATIAKKIKPHQSIYIVSTVNDAIVPSWNSEMIYKSAVGAGANATLWLADLEKRVAGDQSQGMISGEHDYALDHLVVQQYFADDYYGEKGYNQRATEFFLAHLERTKN